MVRLWNSCKELKQWEQKHAQSRHHRLHQAGMRGMEEHHCPRAAGGPGLCRAAHVCMGLGTSGGAAQLWRCTQLGGVGAYQGCAQLGWVCVSTGLHLRHHVIHPCPLLCHLYPTPALCSLHLSHCKCLLLLVWLQGYEAAAAHGQPVLAALSRSSCCPVCVPACQLHSYLAANSVTRVVPRAR